MNSLREVAVISDFAMISNHRPVSIFCYFVSWVIMCRLSLLNKFPSFIFSFKSVHFFFLRSLTLSSEDDDDDDTDDGPDDADDGLSHVGGACGGG